VKARPRYEIDRKHPAAITSAALMLTSAVIRTVYYFLNTPDAVTLWLQCINVAAASVLFAVLVIFPIKKAGALTVIPVTMGIVFFVARALEITRGIHTVLCIMLYTAVWVVYTLTVNGVIPTKKLLYPLFGLPFLYHAFYEDVVKYVLAAPMPPFDEWLPEISVLMIMAGLFFLSVSLRRK
jgi:hypothetical protein